MEFHFSRAAGRTFRAGIILILCRDLEQRGSVFLGEPTRRIDVGAKLEVYELVNKLTESGQAVVLVSSELPELMGMSDRILMLAGGRVGGFSPARKRRKSACSRRRWAARPQSCRLPGRSYGFEMVADRYPELNALKPEEQLELAAELAIKAARANGIPELTQRSLEILESRLDYFLAHPNTGVSWEELRGKRIGA